MKPMSVLIIDDEPLARRRLARLVAALPDAEAIGEAGNVHDAFQAIEALSPDIILLDIQIPGGTGFDIVERLGGNGPAVVFVTALARAPSFGRPLVRPSAGVPLTHAAQKVSAALRGMRKNKGFKRHLSPQSAGEPPRTAIPRQRSGRA